MPRRRLRQLQPRLLTSCSSTYNCRTRTASPLRPRSPPPGTCGRPHFVTGSRRLRSTSGFVWSSRLHPQVEAVRRHLRRGARVTSADSVAATQPTRDVLRDPVLVAPFIVAAGLAVGALGIHAHISETRIAADIGSCLGSGRGGPRHPGTAAAAASDVAARRGGVRPSRRRPRVGGHARVVDTRTGPRAALDRGPGRIAARPPGRAAQFARHAVGDRRGLHGDARRAGRRGTGGTGRARPAARSHPTRAPPTQSTGRRSSPESRSRSSSWCYSCGG